MRFRDRDGKFCHAPSSHRAFRNYTGKTFGRLTIERMAGYRKMKNGTACLWKCRCSCGNIRYLTANAFTTGNTKSCGCWKIEVSTARCLARTKHGATRYDIKGKRLTTPEYNSWASMKQRCRDKNCRSWKDYGGATPPVKVCKRWLGENGFENFLHDMGKRPKGTTLGRFLDSGNYEPSNCAWQTRPQQQEERRRKRGNH